MAIRGIFDDTDQMRKKSQNDDTPFSSIGNQDQGLFSNISTGGTRTGELVTGNIEGMLSGDAFDAYKSQSRQKLSRAIANLRRSVGTQFGTTVGQGTYDRAQQRAEQGIFSQLAESNLAADVEKQKMKERGIQAATGLATAEAETRRADTEQQMGQDVLYGYTDRFGNRIRGSQELAGIETDIRGRTAETARELGLEEIASRERLGMRQVGVDEARLSETARQFNISTDQAAQQFTQSLQRDYDQLTQQEQQFLSTLGFNREQFEQARREFAVSSAIQREQIASQERLGMQQLGIDQQRIDETARQFNISTAQAEQQFAESIRKDYAELTQQERQFLASLGLDRDRFQQAQSEFAVSSAIQREQIAAQERMAAATIGMDQQQLAETARQFNVSTAQVAQQFAQSIAKDYAELTQQERQFMTAFGLDEARFNQAKYEYGQNFALEQQKLASNERIATSQLGLDAQRLAETARQFNVSTAQAAQQFTDKLKFDYDSLSQQDQQYLQSLGFDREQFNESKRQFEMNYTLEDKLRTRDLDIQEQQLAQQASQFESRLDFDEWATQAGLDDAASARIWQANQNDRAINANREIQQMVTNLEEWKTKVSANLTRQGWDQESIQNELARQQNLTIAEMQNATQRYIANEQISLADRQLVEQAWQFSTRQNFERWALQENIAQEDAQRIWATKERIASEAFQASQNTFQAQLQKELASGAWTDENGVPVNSLDAQRLVEQVRQFDDQQDWLRESQRMGIQADAAQRAWATNERVNSQIFQNNLAQLQGQLALQGIKYQTVMSTLESMDEDTAFDTVQSLAGDVGFTYTLKDRDGNPIVNEATGEYFTVPGFPPTTSNASQKGFDLMQQLERGDLSYTNFRGAANTNSPNYDEYQQLFDTVNTWDPDVSYDDGGFFGADSRNINNAPAVNSIFKFGDNIYQVTSDVTMNKEGQDSDEFKVVDINTGETKTIRVTGKDSELKISGF